MKYADFYDGMDGWIHLWVCDCDESVSKVVSANHLDRIVYSDLHDVKGIVDIGELTAHKHSLRHHNDRKWQFG